MELLSHENLIIKKEVKDKLELFREEGVNALHVLTDFDRTITLARCTSWAMLSRTNLMPKEYADRRNAYYDIYRPIEIDPNISQEERKEKMVEWWQKHLNLLVEYKVKRSQLREVVTNYDLVTMRPGSMEFLATLNEYNVPVMIISAGLGDFVKLVLEVNKALFPNIFLVSNMLKFNDRDEAVGLEKTIIHPFNKDEKDLPPDVKILIESRPNVLLLGDTLDDIRMANLSPKQSILSFGFLDEGIEANLLHFKEAYDVVLKNEQPMDFPNQVLNEIVGE